MQVSTRTRIARLLDASASLGAIGVLVFLVGGALLPQRERTPDAPPRTAAADSSAAVRLRYVFATGHQIGVSTAPVKMILFGSYRCHYCIRFMAQIEMAMARYPDMIALSYHHNEGRPDPLSGGYRLALAAECAEEQGRFARFSSLAYSRAIRLATNPSVRALAVEAGVSHPDSLLRCVEQARYAARLARDDSLVKDLGIKGTPFWFLNGEPHLGIALPGQLDSLIMHAVETTTTAERARRLRPFPNDSAARR